MLAGGVTGVVASFLQTLEKLVLIENKDAILQCNFNSIFNCSTVLNAWQSSLFGFPNSIMCMALFVIFSSVAMVGAFGGLVSRGVRLGVHGLTLFTLCFALWFLWQSTYVIGALCIFCIFCFGGLLVLNWGWLRQNSNDLPIGEQGRNVVKRWIASGIDTFIWASVAVVVVAAMVIRFSL